MSKPYPGIPAGTLDEDLEKHMTEKKGPFDAVIELIKEHSDWSRNEHGIVCYPKDISNAIRVLEAAGKVDKKKTIKILNECFMFLANHGWHIPNPDIIKAMTLFHALPDKEGEKK